MSFLYPPILPSTYPAFLAIMPNLTIPYSLSKMMDDSEVRHIDIVISRQRDNFNMVRKSVDDGESVTSVHPDGIIYQEYIPGTRTVIISSSDLSAPWQVGEVYKIQVRFGKGELWNNFPDITTDWATWKTEQINNSNFGEWSNVMLIKAITAPDVHTPYTIDETELLPTFYGSCESEDGEDSYQFIIKHNSDIVEESNWLKHTDYTDTWKPNNPLDNGVKYTIIYRITTINGYVAQNSFTYTPYSSDITKLEGINIIATPNHEEGYIEVTITSASPLTGNHVISRSDDQVHWEDVRYFLCSEATTITYRDYCIESGVLYYYGFQYENTFRYRTYRNVIEYPECCYFEHCYLYANGVQLKLEFDNKISSFKYTTLTSKQDTLGSKYPTISRNGYAYYGEFSLNGLISYHMNSESFFSIGQEGLYYRDELVIRKRKDSEGNDIFPTREIDTNPEIAPYLSYDIDTNPTQSNIYIERKFREKAEEFLNDGNYKLFKSPTEGTMIVALTNVQLQPNETLHRLISNFSATVYEVAEFNRNNLQELGLEDTGTWKDIVHADYVQMAGAILVDTPPVDLITSIRTTLAGEGKTFHHLIKFWVDGVETDTIVSLTLIIDGSQQKIFVMPGRTYYIDELSESAVIEVQANSAMNFNYVCDYSVQEDLRQLKRIFSYSNVYLYAVAQSASPWDAISIIETAKIGQKLLRAEQVAFNDQTITEIATGHYINSNSTLEFYDADDGLEWIEFTNLTPDIPMTITIGNNTIHYIPAAANSTMRFYPARDGITAITFDSQPIGIDMTTKMNFIGYEYEVS